MSYVLVFGVGLLILLVGYSPVAALGATTGSFIRRVRARRAARRYLSTDEGEQRHGS